ncbi:MAG: hypothetical protein ACH346_04575 [Chthoniobacterales bacterium]
MTSPRNSLIFSFFFFIHIIVQGASLAQSAAIASPSLETDFFVTATEYCDFLNSVAATDSEHLYNEKMGTDSTAASIVRIGSSGTYNYLVIQGKENLPISYANETAQQRYAAWVEQADFPLMTAADDGSLTSNRSNFFSHKLAVNPLSPLSFLHNNQNENFLELSTNQKIVLSFIAAGLFLSPGMMEGDFLNNREMNTPPGNPSTESTVFYPYHEVEGETPNEGGNTREVKAPDQRGLKPVSIGIIDPFCLEKMNSLTEQTKVYQNELKALSLQSPHSLRKDVFDAFIKLKKYASEYHSLLVDHLRGRPERRAVHKEAYLAYDLYCLDRINSSPNKVEKIAEKFDQVGRHIIENQEKLSSVQTALDADPNNNRLVNQRNNLNKLITVQRYLMDQSICYAEFLLNHPPFGELPPVDQVLLEKNKTIYELLAASSEACQQAAEIEAQGQQQSARYLNNAGWSFRCAARETLQDQPNKRAINLLTGSANAYEQAAEAEAQGEQQCARYLNNAGLSFHEAAMEALEDQPNERTISLFIGSANACQQAAETVVQGEQQCARYLNNAGLSFFEAAREALKDQPNERAINLFTGSANAYEQASETEAQGEQQCARYLNNAGLSFNEAAREALQDQPNERAINLFTGSANAYEQAAEAEAQGQQQRARYLNNAGLSFNKAAREALQDQPNQAAINESIQIANVCEQAAEIGAQR